MPTLFSIESHAYFINLNMLCFFILIFSFHNITGQIQQNTTHARQLKKVESLLTQKKLDSSVLYLRKLLNSELKLSKENQQETIIYYDRIGLAYSKLGKYEKALNYFKTFLDMIIEKYGKDHLYVGYAYLNIGISFKNLLQYEEALGSYNKAFKVFWNSKKRDMIAFMYNHMAGVYEKKEEYGKAIHYYNASVKITNGLFGKNYIENAKTYKKIGILYYYTKEYDKAISYYEKSITVFSHTQGKNNLFVAELNNIIGEVYLNQQEYEVSLKYLKKSIKIYQTFLNNDNPKIIDLYVKIVDIYAKREIYDKEALEYSEKGLGVLQESYGENHLLTSIFYYSIAKAYDRNGELKKAISFFDKAFISNKKNKLADENPLNSDQYYDTLLFLLILKGKSLTLQKNYTKTLNLDYLQNSLLLYQQADISINYIRKSYKDPGDKILFSSKVRELYSDAIKALFLFYKKTKNEQVFEKIVYYMEKSKANALKDFLSDAKAKDFAGLPSHLLEFEKNQKIEKAFYQSRIIEEKSNRLVDYSKIIGYEKKLLRIDIAEDSLVTLLEKEYPKYYQLKYENRTVLVNEIQKKIGDKSNLLEFFVSGNTVYILTITKNNIDIKECIIPSLTEKVTQYRKSIIEKDIKGYKSNAYKLYCDLIVPVKSKFIGENLVIIPDGVLWHVNFDLLLSSNVAYSK